MSTLYSTPSKVHAYYSVIMDSRSTSSTMSFITHSHKVVLKDVDGDCDKNDNKFGRLRPISKKDLMKENGTYLFKPFHTRNIYKNVLSPYRSKTILSNERYIIYGVNMGLINTIVDKIRLLDCS